MTTLLLALSYPLLVVAKLMNALLGRDPLRHKQPRAESFWVERAEPKDDAYFLETSPAERGLRSAGWLPELLLVWLSRFYAPARSTPHEKFTAGADREQGIPDEMYTLW